MSASDSLKPGSNTVAAERAQLLGSWRLVSQVVIDEKTGQEVRRLSEGSKGYLVFLPSRMFAFVTFGKRPDAPPPQAGEEPPRPVPPMMAYSGPYDVTGDLLTTDVDMSAFDGWLGTKQKRSFTIKGDILEIIPVLGPEVNTRGVYSILTWQRDD